MRKVLHVTEELSKKNYSISSLIFFLSDFIESKIDIKHTILTDSLQTDIFEKTSNLKIINFKLFRNFFKTNKIISKCIKEVDTVHIHGLWRYINFFSIFYCIINNKNFYIHPHGMLLDAALKNKGFINFIFKKFVIYLYKIIIGSNAKFISITDKETLSIKYNFTKSKIQFIPNPIPFNYKKVEPNKIDKTFVFFGRIHPIKNLELMINSFINAKLKKEWKLHIYGIEDDDIYLLKLKNLIKNQDNIEIKNPIFGDKKQEILKSSWANILLSKSEVLSLSVLESASMQLPSIVNQDIEIDQFTKYEGVSTKVESKEITRNLGEVSNWSLEQRKIKGKLLKSFIEKNYSIETIAKKYFELYKNIELDKKQYFKNLINLSANFIRKYSIINTSLSYIFNLMIPTFTMVMLVLSGNVVMGAEVALINSLWLTATQIFSNNVRSQAIAKNNVVFLEKNISFRFLWTVLAILIITSTDLLKFLVNSENEIFYLKIISLVILAQWIFELILTSYELSKDTFKIILINLLNMFFCVLLIFGIIFGNENILNYVYSIYLIILILIISFETKNYFIKGLKDSFKIIIENIKNVAFYSSFSIIFSSFVWRYLIFIFYPKEIAAVFFACFSIGSFPATIFNSSIGPTFVKQNIKLNSNLTKVLFLVFVVTIFFGIFSFLNIHFREVPLFSFMNNFVILTLSFSLIGSFLMTYAMYLRQINIQSNIGLREKTFWLDTVYGSSITILLPILYYFNSIYYVSLTFFLASVIGLTIYGIFSKYKSKILLN